MKLTDKQKECLGWLYRGEERSPYWDCKDDGGFKTRTFKSLLERGLVLWNAISPDTWGGWFLTPKGKTVAKEYAE